MHNWSFEEEACHSALVRRIMALQEKEHLFHTQINATCPSDNEGQVAFIYRLGKAILFYRELLTLFSLFLQQDVTSPPRRTDVAKANQIYGKILHDLTGQLDAVIRTNREQLLCTSLDAGWRNFITTKNTSKRLGKKAFASHMKQEKKCQKQYFDITATIHSLNPAPTEEPSIIPRKNREKSWLEENQAWENMEHELDAVFDNLLQSRQALATSLGFKNYLQLLEQKQPSKNFPSPSSGKISASCRELLSRLHQHRKDHLGLVRLRPFDMNTRNIKVFGGVDDWVAKTGTLLREMHPTLLDVFRSIISEDLFDILPNNGKTPADFCLQLPYSQKPYMFMNLRGSRKDVMTGIHEVGHAIHIHLLFNRFNKFFNYKVNPATSEFFALTLELLSLPHMDCYYAGDDISSWARTKFIESLLTSFLTFDTINTFEKSIYREAISAAECKQRFREAISGNLGLLDYTGYEKALELWAYRIPLLVSSPGYFLNYARTQLGALFFFDGVRNGKFSIADYVSLMERKCNSDVDEIFDEICYTETEESIDSMFCTLSAIAYN